MHEADGSDRSGMSGDGVPGSRVPAGAGMDVPRGGSRAVPRLALALIALFGLALLTLFIERLKPASPAVPADLLVTATVRRGGIPIEVRGWGQLAADGVEKLEATVAGRVTSIPVARGDPVQDGAPLVELANPDLVLEAARAEERLTTAKAAFAALKRAIGAQRLERESRLVEARSALERERRNLDRLEKQVARGEVDAQEVAAARRALETLEEEIRVEEEHLVLLNETGEEQVSLEKERFVALATVYERERERCASLRVAAPAAGIIDSVAVAVGDWVIPGTPLVSLVRPEGLRAELKLLKRSAGRVKSGDTVLLIDGVGDSTAGQVQFIGEPTAEPDDGYVQISVDLDVAPSPAAAADAGVDARIRLGSVEDVLYVERPAWVEEEQVAYIFRVGPDGTYAERVKVGFGSGSPDRIEVREGLEEGDVIIVSDMSRFAARQRVRIE